MGTVIGLGSVVTILVGLVMFIIGGIMKTIVGVDIDEWSWWMGYGILWLFCGVTGVLIASKIDDA